MVDIETQGKEKQTKIRSGSYLPRMNLAIAVFLGILIGSALQHSLSSIWDAPSNKTQDKKGNAVKKGIITNISETPFRPTSHVDSKGRPIEKQQFLEPFVIPNFVGYSVATFKPGQTMMPVHEHESLHEFFYVLEGSGMFQVNGVDHKVEKGWFLHMAPHDKHGIWVPEDSPDGDLKLAVSGITLD